MPPHIVVTTVSGVYASRKSFGLSEALTVRNHRTWKRRSTQPEATVVMDEQQGRYADLIECSARILAFDGLIDAALPVLASALTSEAVRSAQRLGGVFPQ